MRILLGVCGGVAAYKSAELLRELQRRGADVQVVMTADAERFVTPLTFASLSGHQVLTSLWQPSTSEHALGNPASFEIEHISLAQKADAVVIAPATANTLAKLAHGLADDLLTTLCLATTAPIFLAPAMNVNMWRNLSTQTNLETLRSRGISIIAPAEGYLACGMIGEGRLASPSEITDAVISTTRRKQNLAGETILITAGGTREPIDPVRFISNRSSGKMGLALTDAALRRGAEVIFITAKGIPSPSLPCEQIFFTTAGELQTAALEHLPRATAVIMAAAVADFRVLHPANRKLKKRDSLTLELVRTDDILQHIVRKRRAGTIVVGFAAETERVLEEGRRKLREKGLDAIVVNDVSKPGSGFEADHNEGVLLTQNSEIALPFSTKSEMAERILDQFLSLRPHIPLLPMPFKMV